MPSRAFSGLLLLSIAVSAVTGQACECVSTTTEAPTTTVTSGNGGIINVHLNSTINKLHLSVGNVLVATLKLAEGDISQTPVVELEVKKTLSLLGDIVFALKANVNETRIVLVDKYSDAVNGVLTMVNGTVRGVTKVANGAVKSVVSFAENDFVDAVANAVSLITTQVTNYGSAGTQSSSNIVLGAITGLGGLLGGIVGGLGGLLGGLLG